MGRIFFGFHRDGFSVDGEAVALDGDRLVVLGDFARVLVSLDLGHHGASLLRDRALFFPFFAGQFDRGAVNFDRLGFLGAVFDAYRNPIGLGDLDCAYQRSCHGCRRGGGKGAGLALRRAQGIRPNRPMPMNRIAKPEAVWRLGRVARAYRGSLSALRSSMHIRGPVRGAQNDAVT